MNMRVATCQLVQRPSCSCCLYECTVQRTAYSWPAASYISMGPMVSVFVSRLICMAGAFRWKFRSLNRKGVTPATPSPADAGKRTTKNVAQA
jgi:hypothetical protein